MGAGHGAHAAGGVEPGVGPASAATASASCSRRSASSARSLARQRTCAVDLLGELGDVGEDAHRVAAHLHETTVDGDVEHRAVDQGDPGVVLGEGAEERSVTGQERDLATTQGAR